MLSLTAKHKTDLLRIVVLVLIALTAFGSRLFSVIRYESIIHEFDPWFNYRTTRYLVEHGFDAFWNWFDEESWYPLGRVVGGTVYPGIMVTAALMHKAAHFLGFPLHIREVCVFLAPVFSGATALATYLFTKELGSSSAGLLAALFVGIAPGYISRSVAGSYDNEGIAIFLLMLTYYLWIKSVKLGSMFWAGLAALAYFYMVSAWGGYVFIINLVPLHVLVLMLMGRFDHRIYVSYSTFYAVGTLYSMQVPFVGFQPTRTSEHMAALGVFGLVQMYAFVKFLRHHLPSKHFNTLVGSFALMLVGLVAAVASALSSKGLIAPWAGRFYSLWDTDYARQHIPIIASVSEHQPTAWPSIFFDLQILTFLFPAGLYLCFRELRNEHVFLILYSLSATYFAGVMVRLILTLTPVMCVAGGLAMSRMLDAYLELPEDMSETQTQTPTDADRPATKSAKPKRNAIGLDTRFIVIVNSVFLLLLFVWHCTWVTSNAYSSPSVVLSSWQPDGSQYIIDDFREAYRWISQNTKEDARILSWWDYGYQMAGMANRTTLVDNNTWNNTHIATVGLALASNEEDAYKVMQPLDVDYVLVVFGGVLGYSGDDINKFLWMIRIAEGVYPDRVSERDFYNARGEYRVDDSASVTLRESIMYKMSFYQFNELYGGRAHDRVRGTEIQSAPITFTHFEEAYTTENWIVRIFKVKRPDQLGRTMADATSFDQGKRKKRYVLKA